MSRDQTASAPLLHAVPEVRITGKAGLPGLEVPRPGECKKHACDKINCPYHYGLHHGFPVCVIGHKHNHCKKQGEGKDVGSRPEQTEKEGGNCIAHGAYDPEIREKKKNAKSKQYYDA